MNALKLLKPLYWLPMRRRFQIITARRLWGGNESLSGEGSDLASTVTIRDALPGLFAELGVKSLLDVPCGDFHWMNEVPLDGIDYTGGDILPSLIEVNTQFFSDDDTRFREIDLTKDELPKADLLLCRDCLVHLSNRLVIKALNNVQQSGCTWFLSTTFPAIAKNNDIPTGSWRPINLTLAPFNLPQPTRTIRDSDNQPEGLPNAVLGLWRVSDFPLKSA